MKSQKIRFLLILLLLIGMIGSALLISFVKDWNKPNLTTVMCRSKDLILNKDIEGNTFIFEDSSANQNLKTNHITYYEVTLGIKSYALIKQEGKPNLIYISKNQEITKDEKTNLSECFSNSRLEVINNAKFNQ
jgi:hypothetical protein